MISMMPLLILLATNHVLGILTTFALRDDDVEIPRNKRILYTILFLLFGVTPVFLFVLIKDQLYKSEYYKRNGYLIPTKANRSKKLLRTLSE